MTPQAQHDAEDRLRDLMVLGDIALTVCRNGAESGNTATVPAEWFGLFGRLTYRLANEVSDLMGDLPEL